MSKLWTFGCSFTHGFHLDDFSNGSNIMVQYYNWRNKTLPKIWPEILSEKLELELENHAWPGSSIYKIFDRFCKQCHKFQKGDVVIYEWTRIHRFRMYEPGIDGCLPTILPIFNPNIDNGSQPITKQAIIEMQVNRTERPWIEEIYSFQKLIIEICKSIGCEFYIWSADDFIINRESQEFKESINCLIPHATHDVTQYLRLVYGANTIWEDTNKKVDDQQHYGETGHKVMAEMFYDDIINYRNKK
jgi:hypothetical protein